MKAKKVTRNCPKKEMSRVLFCEGCAKMISRSYYRVRVEITRRKERVYLSKHGVRLTKEYRKPRGWWTKEKIIEAIKSEYISGQDISVSKISFRNKALIAAAVRRFGSWRKAVECCAINYDEIKIDNKCWTYEKVISSVIELKKSETDFSFRHCSRLYPALYRASYVYANGWAEACEIAGIDIEAHSKVNRWTKEKITHELNRIYNTGGKINSASLRNTNKGLFDACSYHFGSYENAVQQSGIRYEEIVLNHLSFSRVGVLFEKVVRDILIDLDYTFDFQKQVDGIRPDFWLKHDVFLDAKLSDYTLFNSKTISNYKDKCKLLSIVVLLGNKDRDEMVSEKTRLISVFKLIKQLPKTLRRFYTKKVKSLSSQIYKLKRTKLSEVGNRSTSETDGGNRSVEVEVV